MSINATIVTPRIAYYLAPISAAYTPGYVAYNYILGIRSFILNRNIESKPTASDIVVKRQKLIRLREAHAQSAGTYALTLLIITLAELNNASTRTLHALLGTTLVSHILHTELSIRYGSEHSRTRMVGHITHQCVPIAAAISAAYLTWKRVF